MPRGVKNVKKGRPSWDESSTLLVYNKDGSLFDEGDDGFVYRWEVNDPANLQLQQSRGWEIVSKVGNDPTLRGREGDSIDDGAQLTTVNEYRELVRMRLPKALAEDRRQYMQEKADRQMSIVENATGAHGDLESARRGSPSGISPTRTNVRIT